MIFSAEEITGGYSRADQILKGVTISADLGETVAILGPNGAGKSTFLKAVTGLLPRVEGTIYFDGRPIDGLRPKQVAEHGIGFVPQENNVFPSLSIHENLEIGGYLTSDTQRRIEEIYDCFPLLAKRRAEAARALSGGQRQILAMAIAMVHASRMLLLDEPSAGLAPKSAGELFETIRQIAGCSIAVILVEQNALAALKTCDRAYILSAGSNHITGTGTELANDPNIRETFLGGRKH